MKQCLLFLSALLLHITAADANPSFRILHWKTSNGAEVVFYQAMDVPMLDISIAFRAGSAFDKKNYGLSMLTTTLLDQGNSGLSSDAIAKKLAETGAQYEGGSTKDMALLRLRTLTEKTALNKAIGVFASILSHPDFTKEAFLREKNQQLMAITQSQESPDELANQRFFQALYKNHPYAHPVNGDQQSVSQITIEQINDFYHQYFVSHNALIVLVGAIDKPTAVQIAERLFKELPTGKAAPTVPMPTMLNEAVDIEVNFPSSQTAIRLGQLGMTHHDQHFFPLQVGNYILGGGSMVSQLAKELREKKGLTYGVYSQFSPMLARGPFLISLSTKNNQANLAGQLTRETMAKFIENGPSEAELQAAKHYLTGNFPISLSSNRQIAEVLLRMTFYHLPNDFLKTYVERINAVSTAEVKAAFKADINPKKLLQVTVGPLLSNQ